MRGEWFNVINGEKKHYVLAGQQKALCGAGKSERGKLGEKASEGREGRCQRCLDGILAIGVRNRRKMRLVGELLEKLTPAERTQVAAAIPSHAWEDSSADWWTTEAPNIIQSMKDAIKGNA